MNIGVLAFHGDVIEHIETTKHAASNLHINIRVIPVRTKEIISRLDALIIPGGESTTLYKLCEREKMWEKMKKIKNIFGTCAGTIMLAKIIRHKTRDQKTLELMDIEVNRNAYGKQTESFEQNIHSRLGKIRAIFIRAPKILRIGKNIKILAKIDREIIACEEEENSRYYLATCFHPELSSTMFHEYFLKKIFRK
jgi:5'-phosphate synthase pdxT subunit